MNSDAFWWCCGPLDQHSSSWITHMSACSERTFVEMQEVIWNTWWYSFCTAWNSCSRRFCGWIWVAGQRLKFTFLYSMKQGGNRRSRMKYEMMWIFRNAWKHIVLSSIWIAASRSKWKLDLSRCRKLIARGTRWTLIEFGMILIFQHLAEITVLSQHALWQLNY